MEKLYCHNCDQHVNFSVEEKKFNYKVKDMSIPISGKIALCDECASELFHPEYDVDNQEMAFSIYRKRKGIIDPKEIVDIRKKYGLSQRDFSRLLGFGEITISRYENGSLPTQAQNQIIKASADPNKMYEFYQDNKDKISENERLRVESLLNELCSQSKIEEQIISQIKSVFNHEPDILSGLKTFAYDKFNQMVLFFAAKEKPYKTKLNKLLFYADNYFYKLHDRAISGARYIRHNYGPVPEKYQTLYDNMSNIQLLEDQFGEFVVPMEKFDDSLFSDAELSMLEFVYSKFKFMISKQISEFSHQEDGWLNTPHENYIPFTFAKNLDMDRRD